MAELKETIGTGHQLEGVLEEAVSHIELKVELVDQLNEKLEGSHQLSSELQVIDACVGLQLSALYRPETCGWSPCNRESRPPQTGCSRYSNMTLQSVLTSRFPLLPAFQYWMSDEHGSGDHGAAGSLFVCSAH